MKNNVLKAIAGVAMSAVMVASLAGCGSAEVTVAQETVSEDEASDESAAEDAVADETDVSDQIQDETDEITASEEEMVGDEEMGDYPQNFMEERAGQYEFDSYDEIISLLEDGECYGFANVMGSDEEVLFIANEYFTGYGYPAVIECYPYIKNPTGKYSCGGVLFSGGTANPISVSDDGLIFTGNHTEVEESALSQENGGVMIVVYAYVEWGQDGTDDTYGGFVRETNSIANDGIEIAPGDGSVFEQAFADYAEATPIAFTVVGDEDAVYEVTAE